MLLRQSSYTCGIYYYYQHNDMAIWIIIFTFSLSLQFCKLNLMLVNSRTAYYLKVNWVGQIIRNRFHWLVFGLLVPTIIISYVYDWLYYYYYYYYKSHKTNSLSAHVPTNRFQICTRLTFDAYRLVDTLIIKFCIFSPNIVSRGLPPDMKSVYLHT